MRVAILFDHLGPYHIARIRAAAEGVEIVAIECHGRSREYEWDPSEGEVPFSRVTLFADSETQGQAGESLLVRLKKAIVNCAPDVILLPGWSGQAAFGAMLIALRQKIPVVLMSESTAHDEVRKAFREGIKRRYVALSSSALAGGTAHAEYLRELGMPVDHLFTGYDVVDNAYFAREAARWRSGPDAAPPCFLASARFIPKKNLHRLLEAYARYAEPKSDIQNRGAGPTQSEMPHAWSLCLLGDGELKGDLLAHAQSLDLTVIECAPWELQTKNEAPGTKNEEPSAPPTIFLPGFRQIEELPRFYAAAGAFVHASTTEQWGLVVNEAMACGLPVLVSDRCGCAPDLVSDGENGWTFDPTDVGALTDLMSRIAALPEDKRRELGAASERLIADWGPDRFASGLLDAANCAAAVGPKRAGWLDRLLLKALARR